MSLNVPTIDYYQIDTNFKILFLNVGKNVFSCEMMVMVGSRVENEEELGLAHFFEHMILKGNIGDKMVVDIMHQHLMIERIILLMVPLSIMK
jgi:predicted Zn-dependent peptidase